jgi:Flp pilus assembly secretin CpaC
MNGMTRTLILGFGLLGAGHAAAQFSSANLTVLPYVQPNGTIHLGLNANWQFTQPGYGPSRATINTQYLAANGMPITVGSYARQLRTFNNQNVPYLGRAPFVGGLFRNRAQFNQMSYGYFAPQVTITRVDPAGNPVQPHAPLFYGRVPAPRMMGFIQP